MVDGGMGLQSVKFEAPFASVIPFFIDNGVTFIGIYFEVL